MIILAISAYPQNYAHRYEEYLPDNIKNNFNKLKIISFEIEKKSKIHPDLIYHYLESLKESNQNISYNKYLNEVENYYELKKKSWIENHISEIKSRVQDKRIQKKTISILNKSLTEIKVDSNIKIIIPEYDQNQIDYYVLKYYDENFRDEYINIIDYSKIRKHIENERKIHLLRSVEDAKDLEYINKILDNWYIFAERNPDFIKVHKLILNLIKNHYSDINEHINNNKESLGIGLGYIFSINVLKVNKLFFSSNHLSFNLNKKLNSHAINFGLFYLLPLQDKNTFVSYLHFEINLSRNFIPKENEIKRLKFVASSSGEDLDYDAEISVSTANSVLLNLNIPIFSYDQSMVFEGGFAFRWDKINYIINYKYDYRRWRNFYGTIDSDYKEELLNEQLSQFSYIPFVNIVFKFLPYMNINLKGAYNLISINTYYIF
jgi:hypothetical protein